MADGTAARSAAAKRARRHLPPGDRARALLGDLSLKGDRCAYHIWLPPARPSLAGRSLCGRRGTARHRGRPRERLRGDCSGHAPNAVRLALAAPPTVDVLAEALGVLAGLAQGAPEDTGAE